MLGHIRFGQVHVGKFHNVRNFKVQKLVSQRFKQIFVGRFRFQFLAYLGDGLRVFGIAAIVLQAVDHSVKVGKIFAHRANGCGRELVFYVEKPLRAVAHCRGNGRNAALRAVRRNVRKRRARKLLRSELGDNFVGGVDKIYSVLIVAFVEFFCIAVNCGELVFI